MRRIGLIAAGFSVLLAPAVPVGRAATPWDQPAAALADEIAAILGPGQAQLAVRNLSTISNDDVPGIERLLEQDLKAHGVLVSGMESANAIRVTLSQDARERLWVAEVVEGNQTQVAMVRLDRGTLQNAHDSDGLVLRSQKLIAGQEVILAALVFPAEIVMLEPEYITIYFRDQDGWRQQTRLAIGQKRPLPRDPRGILLPGPSGTGFEAWVAGTHCAGDTSVLQEANSWPIHCEQSDDPWPVAGGAGTPVSGMQLRAFFNANRNYFTGIVTPASGAELPAFYSAAWVPRPAEAYAFLVAGIDAKVQLVENGSAMAVRGTRDWGSDFAALASGCGSGTQIIASGSGEAASDSLRAFELPALEAIPASAPLAMNGTVTALSTAPDGKSVLAVVRSAADDYEVDRVTALCN